MKNQLENKADIKDYIIDEVVHLELLNWKAQIVWR